MGLIGQPIGVANHLSPLTAKRSGGQPMQSTSQFSHEVRSGSGSPAIMGALVGGSRRYRTPDYRLRATAHAFFGARPALHGCHRGDLSTRALRSGYFNFTGCDCLSGLLVY